MILIVLSGAAVRLTGSGLGCPDWPTCFHHRVTGSLSIHPLIEYSNRIVTILLVLVTVATFIAAINRTERRRDLIWLSGALIGGIVARSSTTVRSTSTGPVRGATYATRTSASSRDSCGSLSWCCWSPAP